jgi:hypothetical protein
VRAVVVRRQPTNNLCCIVEQVMTIFDYFEYYCCVILA